MRTMMNRASAALGLAVWLASASSACCFYNPQTGRWLNRDPVDEVSGAKPLQFVMNQPPNGVDVLGLYDLFIWLHFNVPASRMPHPEHPAPGTTTYVMGYTDHGQWESCGVGGCKKLTGTRLKLEIHEYFRLGEDLGQLSDGGHTLLEHEGIHAQIAIDSYATPTDNDLNQILGRCYRNACADAKWNWFNAAWRLHYAEGELAQIDFEILDFRLWVFDSWQEKRRRLALDVAAEVISVAQAELAAIVACDLNN